MYTYVWQRLEFIALGINFSVIRILHIWPVGVGYLVRSSVVSRTADQRCLLLEWRCNGAATAAERNQ